MSWLILAIAGVLAQAVVFVLLIQNRRHQVRTLNAPSPMLKYLRLAVTTLSLAACVLLVALWVRSYFLADSFQLRIPVVRAGAQSAKGSLAMWIAINEDEDRTFWMPSKHRNVHDIDLYSATTFRAVPIYSNRNPSVSAVYALGLQVPHWFMVILSVAIALLPWLRWRFSLRTLLIATTLAAVGLGIVVVLS